MLEQLGKSFELLLMNYGIWVALVLVLMIVIPVVFLIWMQKRHQAQDHQQLGGHYQTIATLQQQLNGIETILTQYQQQAANFEAATRKQTADLLAQQEDCLARALRLKSELRETEARLPQIGDQVPARLEDLEAEVTGLKASFEQIEAWYKRMHQGVADARTQLHRLQAEIEALPAGPNLEPLWARLRELQAETSPADPVQYQQAIEQLRLDILAQRALPPLPDLSDAARDAVTDASSESAKAPSIPEPMAPLTPSGPAPESPAEPEAPVMQAAQPEPDVPAMPELSVPEPRPYEPTPVTAPPQVAGIEPAAGPPAVDETFTDESAVDETSVDEAGPLPQDLVTDTFLGQQLPETSRDEAASESASKSASEFPSEHDSGREPERDPEAEAFEDTVTETFLGQRGPELSFSVDQGLTEPADADQEAQAAEDASETADSPPADLGSEMSSELPDTSVAAEDQALTDEASDTLDEAPAETHPDASETPADGAELAETPAEARDEIAEATVEGTAAKPAGRLAYKAPGRESAAFAEAGGRLRELADGLARIESSYGELEDAFVPEAWPESVPLLEQSRYRAAEAEELLKLARRLEQVPQAPAHRVQLNLRRLQQKCQQVSDARAQLEQDLAELGGEAGRLEARLRKATEQLQGLRDRVEPDWLHQQAGRLKEVYRFLDNRPFHLPACRQKLRQVEIEIETQAQA